MKIATTDLCDEHYTQLKIAQPIFKNFGGTKSFYGEIVTIKAFENNPLVRKTLSENGKNKVLIVDGGGSLNCAMMGDNIAELAIKNEWSGVVLNACIRDSDAISKLEIGVKALNVNPLKSGKENIGELNVPVSFAGIDFIPGNFIYSDEDGIVVSEHKYF